VNLYVERSAVQARRRLPLSVKNIQLLAPVLIKKVI